MTAGETDWYGPDTATFGDRVAAAREAAGMTQSVLAKRLGVKKSTIDAWEQDTAEPRANRLSMMAGLLNVSIRWLLTGEGEGMEAPAGEFAADPDLTEIAGELRVLRGEMRGLTERAARLEKRLRTLALPAK